jgi:hypothetical protein
MAPRGAAEAPASSSSGGVALVTGATGLVGRLAVTQLVAVAVQCTAMHARRCSAGSGGG